MPMVGHTHGMQRVAECELRVTGYGLRAAGCVRVTGYGLQVAGCEVRVTSYGVRVAGCEVRVTGYEVQVARCGVRVMGYGLQVARCGMSCPGGTFHRSPPIHRWDDESPHRPKPWRGGTLVTSFSCSHAPAWEHAWNRSSSFDQSNRNVRPTFVPEGRSMDEHNTLQRREG